MEGDFNRIIQDVEMAGQNSPNLREISELQNEGGSDVFTSTRHINNTENVRPIFQYIHLRFDGVHPLPPWLHILMYFCAIT